MATLNCGTCSTMHCESRNKPDQQKKIGHPFSPQEAWFNEAFERTLDRAARLRLGIVVC